MLNRLFTAVSERLLLVAAPLHRHRTLRAVFAALLLIPAALLLGLVAVVVRERLALPLDLEWLEGSQVYHAHRLLHGQPIYRLETSGFLPHPYPPVQPLIVAAAGGLFGLDYLTARAVSVAAFIVAAFVLTYQIWRHWAARGAGALLAVVTLGYFAATYGMVEGWYDTARIDSLALVFVVLAAAPLAGERLRWSDVVISAALSALAIYTKQTTVFFAAGLCVVVVRRSWSKGLVMAGVIAAVCAVALVILEQRTLGGFLVWLLNTRHHAIQPLDLLQGAWLVLSRAPFLALLPLLVLGLGQRRLSPRAALWLGMLIAAVPAGLIPYAKQGGAHNSLIPVWFLAGPTALILLGDLVRSAEPAARRGALAAVLVLQALYLPFFVFDPARATLDAAGLQRARALNRATASLDGGVVCPLSPFLPVRNGHQTPQASWLAHTDAMNARMPGVTAASYASWLRVVRPRWVLLPDDSAKGAAGLRRLIGARYRFDRELVAPRWGNRWQTNPVSRRLYRLVDSEAATTPSVPATR